MVITSTTRVQVTGCGIIGLSIAWELAKLGIPVTSYDRGRTGREASWAGAGMLAPGGECTERTRWLDLALESLALYPDFVRQLQEESGLRIDFRICGAVETADSGLDTRAESQQALGIRSERISDHERFFPDDAVVDPRDILAALVIACRNRGVEIIENHPVEKIEGPAVIAAGAWSGSIQAGVPLEPTFPVRGHLISYANPRPPGPIRRSGHTYLLDRASGITIAGTSVEQVGFDREIDPATVADIDRRARAVRPELGPILDAWIGFRPATASLQPEIGRIPGTDIFRAYGHYRNGILLAPVTAKLIAGEMR
jgi:glycine oxidase